MAKKKYTIVYEIDGDEEFQKKWWNDNIHPLFQATSELPQPVVITAASLFDEITRLNCIEHVVEDTKREFDDPAYKIETIQELMVHEDPLAWWKENVDKETG